MVNIHDEFFRAEKTTHHFHFSPSAITRPLTPLSPPICLFILSVSLPLRSVCGLFGLQSGFKWTKRLQVGVIAVSATAVKGNTFQFLHYKKKITAGLTSLATQGVRKPPKDYEGLLWCYFYIFWPLSLVYLFPNCRWHKFPSEFSVKFLKWISRKLMQINVRFHPQLSCELAVTSVEINSWWCH